jgi:uncharacterized protein with HEPN domain
MAAAAAAIEAYAARGRAVFESDPAVRDAVLYQVIVLGEAAKAALAADPGLPAKLPEVDWSPIARMRDRVAHHYWATDLEVVWATAIDAVPALRQALERAIERLR